jgi:hypothetical protein
VTMLTILVPTIGRATLARTLRSIELQRHHYLKLDVIVIGDAHGHDLDGVEDTVRDFRNWLPIRYVPLDTGFNSWGHMNCQAALSLARGEWLHRMDDDDIYVPSALNWFEEAIHETVPVQPIMWQFLDPSRTRLWRESRPAMTIGEVGTPTMLLPLLEGRVGSWTSRYEGDFDFIESTMRKWVNGARWISKVICITRPNPVEDWTRD